MINKNIVKTLKSLITVSKYYEDMIFDLKLIYSDRIHYYGNIADKVELDRIKSHLNMLVEFDVKPIIKNRVYVVNGMECIMAVCVGISDLSASKIIQDLRNALSVCDKLPIKEIDPNFISTIYVFENEKAIYSADFYPSMLGFIIQAFRKNNLIRCNGAEYWFND